MLCLFKTTSWQKRKSEYKVYSPILISLIENNFKVKIPVSGFSMKPALFPGDLVLIQKFPDNDYRPDDIIISKQNNKLIAHRLIQKIKTISNTYYLCKGDAITRYDNLIPKHQILAKVTAIIKQKRIF